MSGDTFQFDMAQMLRQSHCERKDRPHDCVGTTIISKGKVCLDCPLCGKGEDIPGWRTFTANRLDMIFRAAGVKWDSLNIESQVAAIREYERIQEMK